MAWIALSLFTVFRRFVIIRRLSEPIDLVLAQAVLEARRAAAARGEQDALPDDGSAPADAQASGTHA